MSSHFHGRPLTPRRGSELNVLIVARISTVKQDARSLSEQESLCRQYVASRFSGEVHYQVIASQGSGEHLDRKELFQIQDLIETGTLDLVILEDLARLCRRNRAVDICELCVDVDTRLIAINDHLDTVDESWRVSGLLASFQHEQHNSKLSKRLKDRLRERFKTGGALADPIFGYCKPADATSDAQMFKDPAAQPIYTEWFRRLESGASYCEVADWLNDQGIEPGPYSRSKRWTGRAVMRVTFNPILKGVRQRNKKESRRNNKTGHRRSVDAAPDRLLERVCSHLVFIEPIDYDRITALLREKNAAYARGRQAKAADSRKGVSRKRTCWPGQHLRCGICRRLFYWGGHGVKEHMMCAGSRDYVCWNSATFDGHDAARRFGEAILARIEQLPDFDPVFVQTLKARAKLQRSSRGQALIQVREQLREIAQKIDRVTDAIATTGGIPSLVEKLKTLEKELAKLKRLESEHLEEPSVEFVLPTMEVLRGQARKVIGDLAGSSPEFGRVMQLLMPQVTVYPHRLCDGGKVVQRAKVVLNLTSLFAGPIPQDFDLGLFQHEITVDLFDPPQRAAFRERVVALRAQGLSNRVIASQLELTLPAVQHAIALDRLMQHCGLNDPYIALTEPVEDSTKLTRHRHPRYRFQPLDDAE